MIPVYLGGWGIWTAGYPNAQTWASGAPAAEPVAPAAAILGAHKRRASALTRMAVEAMSQAAAQSGASLASTPTVWASAYGEIATTLEILRSFHEDVGLPSPTKFHNSVHNTASGYASIASGNKGFATSIAAGRDCLAMGLLDAAGLLAERGGQVLLAVFDEPPPAPFERDPNFPAAALAFQLSAEPLPCSRAKLSAMGSRATAPRAIRQPFAAHPQAFAFGLLDALTAGQAGPISLGTSWAADLELLEKRP